MSINDFVISFSYDGVGNLLHIKISDSSGGKVSDILRLKLLERYSVSNESILDTYISVNLANSVVYCMYKIDSILYKNKNNIYRKIYSKEYLLYRYFGEKEYQKESLKIAREVYNRIPDSMVTKDLYNSMKIGEFKIDIFNNTGVDKNEDKLVLLFSRYPVSGQEDRYYLAVSFVTGPDLLVPAPNIVIKMFYRMGKNTDKDCIAENYYVIKGDTKLEENVVYDVNSIINELVKIQGKSIVYYLSNI